MPRLFLKNIFNPCGESEQLIVLFSFAKMAERSEVESTM